MGDKRKELLDFLNSGGTGNPETDHLHAEELLLALLGDEEISKAWEDTPMTWWYA